LSTAFAVGLSPAPVKHVSIASPKIPYGGFSPVRLQGRHFRWRLPIGVFEPHHPVCLHPSCPLLQNPQSRSEPGGLPSGTPPLGRTTHPDPRGPRSGPGYIVPVHRHLIGPIRPTRRQRPVSPYYGLYVCLADACLRRLPATGSELSLTHPSQHAVLGDPGDSAGCVCPVPSPAALAFAQSKGARLSQDPHHPLQVGKPFRGYTVRYRYGLPVC
jgi:hypothetical protein